MTPHGRHRGHGLGECRVCHRAVYLTGRGLVQKHWSEAQGGRCCGSGHEPVGVMRGEG